MSESSKEINNSIIIYEGRNGTRVDLKIGDKSNVIWATQEQISQIFDTDRSVITKHIKHIFTDEELGEESNVQKMHIANSDKPVQIYIYATAIDYEEKKNTQEVSVFFAEVQNKLHYAITGKTAADLIIARHNLKDINFGLTN